MLDYLIRGGSVVDGTGAAARTADVGIRGERIVAVGAVDEDARETVDAAGLVVTPGFVDPHTHYDAVEGMPLEALEAGTAMASLLRQSLAAGGLGLSTTRSSTHSDGDGNPVPSRVASEEELLSLCRVVSGCGGRDTETVSTH